MARRYPWVVLFLSFFVDQLFGQEVFELSAGNVAQPSLAVRQADGLLIRDGSGQETFYRRDARFDGGSEWLGYYARDARQALQWPSSNQGPMKIGTQQADQQWQFTPSRMTIRSLGNAPSPRNAVRGNRDVLPPTSANLGPVGTGVADTGRLVSLNWNAHQAPIPIQLGFGDAQRRTFLSRGTAGGLNLVPQNAFGSQNWSIVPVGNGLARVQYINNGSILALGCQNNSSPLDLYALADRADQLWRINPYPGASGCYALESLQYPGQALTFHQNQVVLSPIVYSPYQQWWPTAPILPPAQPVYRNVQQNVIPNPPLPPARVELANRHTDALIVLLADRRPSGTAQKIRIAAGQSQTVSMERDAGATLIETYEVAGGYGGYDRREYRTSIPPVSLYDVSVYEEFLQSIAIDATGTSPNPIEDINYQPRSVGMFIVPPGAALPDQAQFDLHRLATSAKNPGGVRRLSPEDYDQKNPPAEPLKDILRQYQQRRGSF